MKRRSLLLASLGLAVVGVVGCSWFNGTTVRSQSPEEPAPEQPSVTLVGEIAVPTGVQVARVEAVGLVTGLHGTGSDPSPGPDRAALLEEMQARDVANPNAVLSSGNVSLVLIQGYLRPGIQKGEHFDINIRVPSQSDTTSLRGGFLLETRLSETAVLDNQIHRGNLLALAKGPVLVDPMADPNKDRIQCCRGRVLGGGVVLKSRPLGLVIVPEQKSVRNSARVANAVNRRFHTFQEGIQTGVAKAKTDEFIELSVHPRYKDNIARYIRVVRAIPLAGVRAGRVPGQDAPVEQMKRMATLRTQLFDPETSAEAAIQLEAIGTEGVETLLKGVQSNNVEVQFYAAEALAYLDRREAAEPLGRIAREEPAFRVFALTALSVMKDFAAYDQLRDLLALPSAETRYGAFRALWTMNEKDSLVKGEMLGDQFHYHVLDVAGPPMIHVTHNRLPEVVVFGRGQKLLTPLSLGAGNAIMINSAGGDEIAVSKYSVDGGDQKRIVSNKVDDVIRAIVDLGGTYPDVVQALQQAKASGALASRFEIDAIPEAGRTYRRQAAAATPPSDENDADSKRGLGSHAKSTGSGAAHNGGSGGRSADEESEDADSEKGPNPVKAFFARITGRGSKD